MTEGRPLRIATRASELALWQAEHVASLLREVLPDRTVELVYVSTQGDRDRTTSLDQIGGLGVFTREVQRAVLNDHADLAVHSLKDLPTEPAEGLVLAAVPERAAVFDALLLPVGSSGTLQSLPSGARIGTGSPRRQSQLLHTRPDLQPVEIRGNVPTRVEKLDRGDYDAIILAVAGLTRLGMTDRITTVLEPPLMYPAVGQGALGLECRVDDDDTRALLAQLNDPVAWAAVVAERIVLAKLRAGCHAPVGTLATLSATRLRLDACVLSRDGRERVVATASGPLDDPQSVGHAAAEQLLHAGARLLLSESEAGI